MKRGDVATNSVRIVVLDARALAVMGSVCDDNINEGGYKDEVGSRVDRDRCEHRHDLGCIPVRRESKPEEREWYLWKTGRVGCILTLDKGMSRVPRVG